MKRLFLFVAALALVAGGTLGATARAEETWKGTITDSMCGVKHSADKHGDKASDHEACIKRCIERGGEYVFVAGDKVHQIANQSFAALKEHAGHEVMLTGEIKDKKIVVSKIEMPKADKK